MKKVINGKMYNTETAKRLLGWDNGVPSRDFGYCAEELYLSAKGVYFIAGEGGPLSEYAKAVGNDRYSGAGMAAVSKGGALEWCEERDIPVDLVAQHFDIEEG